MIPASFNMATLSPLLAITPSLLALPFSVVPMDEKVSDVLSMTPWSRALS